MSEYKMIDYLSNKEIFDEFNLLLEKANAELKRVSEYLNENNDALMEYHDLKLRDVSSYCYDEMQNDFPLCYENDNDGHYMYFNWFCEDSYNQFKEQIKEDYNDELSAFLHYVGRTSKFYIGDIDELNHDYYSAVAGLLCKFDYLNTCDVNNDNLLYIEQYYFNNLPEYADEIRDEIQKIIDNFYNDVVEYCAPFLTIYDYIDGFKKNQIEYFKDFLSFYESELQDEKTAQENERNADAENARGLIAKYNITPDDVTTLKTTLYAI